MDWELIKNMHNPYGSTIQDYKFLYGFVSLIRPKLIVETGMSAGVSAMVMAYALKDENLDGKIIAVDIDEKLIWVPDVFKKYGLDKYIEVIFGDSPDIIKNIKNIDLAFLDGAHDYNGVKNDYLAVKINANYILIHDTNQFDGIKQFLTEVSALLIDKGDPGQQYSDGKNIYEIFPGFALINMSRESGVGSQESGKDYIVRCYYPHLM